MTDILIMGAGLIGARHVQTVQARARTGVCALTGVVEPDPARHTDPTLRYFPSLDHVDVPVDAVIIATPTGVHQAHGIAAARRGWHMLIEKPVVAIPAEIDDLADAVAQAGSHCLVGHHRRHHPSLHALRQIVTDGAIGRPVTSSLIWAVRKPDAYFQDNWRTTDGSPVMINLIHDIDLIRFVLGEIQDIRTLAGTSLRQSGRIESGGILLGMASGGCATISFADTAPSPWSFEAGTNENPHIAETYQDMWWITGTKGAVSYPSLTVWHGAEDWTQTPHAASMALKSQEEIPPLARQLDHFLAVIAGRETPLSPLADAARSLSVTYQIEQALKAP